MTMHIDAEACERVTQGPGRGTAAEIVGPERCGAKNVRGLLRWLEAGDRLEAAPLPASRQVIYVMEGQGVFELGGKHHAAGPRAGLYLGPGEGAALAHAGSGTLKVFHLVIPPA